MNPGKERLVGASKCARRLVERVGLDVKPEDIRELAGIGAIDVAGTYRPPDSLEDLALFSPTAIDALTDDQVLAAITARLRGTTATLSPAAVVKMLGWTVFELMIAEKMGKLIAHPAGHYMRADVTAAAEDPELQAAIESARAALPGGPTPGRSTPPVGQ